MASAPRRSQVALTSSVTLTRARAFPKFSVPARCCSTGSGRLGGAARLIHVHRRPVAERLEDRRPLALRPALLTEAPDGRLSAEEDGQAEDLAVGIIAQTARLIVG